MEKTRVQPGLYVPHAQPVAHDDEAKVSTLVARAYEETRMLRGELDAARGERDGLQGELVRLRGDNARLTAEMRRFRADALELARAASRLSRRYAEEVNERLTAEAELREHAWGAAPGAQPVPPADAGGPSTRNTLPPAVPGVEDDGEF